jgi:MFS family permease
VLDRTHRLPREVRVLVAARTVNRLGALSVPFLSLNLTRELGVDLTTVGALLAAFGVASVLSRLLGGHLADSWGRRNTMLAGLVSCALAQLMIAAAGSLVTMAIAVISLGLAFEIYEPPSQALIADAVDARTRAAAFGFLTACLSIAALVAGLLAALVAPVSVRLVFVIDATTCLIAAAVLGRLLPADRPLVAPPARERAGPSAWRDPLVRFLLVTNIVFAAGYLQVGVSLPLTMQHRGIGASGYGMLLVTTSAVGLAAQPLLRSRRPPSVPLSARPGHVHTRAIVGGYLLIAVGFAGYGVAHSLTGFLGASAVAGVGEMLVAGHVLAMVSGLAPPYRRARYLATFGLSWGIAGAVGPIPGTWLLEHGGDRALWLAVAGCCVIVGGAHTLAGRRLSVANLRNS